jgi:hypothetical protein
MPPSAGIGPLLCDVLQSCRPVVLYTSPNSPQHPRAPSTYPSLFFFVGKEEGIQGIQELQERPNPPEEDWNSQQRPTTAIENLDVEALQTPPQLQDPQATPGSPTVCPGQLGDNPPQSR